MRPKFALASSTAASIVIEPLAAMTNPQVMRQEATQNVCEGTGDFEGPM